ALEQFLNTSVEVEFSVLAESIPRAAPEPEPLPEPEPEPEPEDTAKQSSGRTKQEWLKDPAVQKTLEMFNGDIADIRD
ncbi:MAG: hypothetical protein AAF492_30215, partial [Verrucomicrobiota bacterium]